MVSCFLKFTVQWDIVHENSNSKLLFYSRDAHQGTKQLLTSFSQILPLIKEETVVQMDRLSRWEIKA